MRTALGLIGGVLLLVALAPAAAAATNVVYQPITVSAPATGEHNVVPVGTVTLAMSATQTAYVVSEMHANAATRITLVDNEVRCSWPGGGKNMVMVQNLYQQGSSDPRWEDISISTRFLVHPGVAATVTCTAYIRTASLHELSSTVRLAGGSLRFADQSIDNTTTGEPAQSSVPNGNLLVDGTHTVRQPALPVFELAPGFTGLSVFGETEYMSCYPRVGRVCDTRGASTAQFTLIVNQWKKDGSLCHTDAATSVTRTLPQQVHHLVVPLNKPNFLVSTAPGCVPKFSAYVLVKWIGGTDGAVQGTAVNLTDSQGSTARHSADMSHIYAVPYRV